jgi:2-polyprenyl-6-hydroxyphenyl methylase/3-demethylubiquinone-9 3-methyltransferase
MSVNEYYNQYWSEDGFLPHGNLEPGRQAFYDSVLGTPGSIVDVGCGDGGTSGPYLTSRGWKYHGVDVSETAILRAQAKGLTASLISDASLLPFETESIDAVLCIEVLEHLFAPRAAAAEAFRILRPGGMFVATVPNVAYWRRRADMFVLGRWNPDGDTLAVDQPWRDPHIRFFNPRSMNAMLHSIGFTDVDISGLDGAILRDIPKVRRLYKGQSSAVFKHLERRWPALWGYRVAVVAVKPPSPAH